MELNEIKIERFNKQEYIHFIKMLVYLSLFLFDEELNLDEK